MDTVPLVSNLLNEVRRWRDRRRRSKAALGVDYLVCRDLDILSEIADGDLSNIPGGHHALQPTPVLGTWSDLAALYEHGVRETEVFSDHFASPGEYRKRFPHSIRIRRDQDLPGFVAWRVVERNELAESEAIADPIASRLLESGTPARYIAIAGLFRDPGCESGVSYYEQFLLAPVWGILLRIRNNSDDALNLHSISGFEYTDSERISRPFELTETAGDEWMAELPPLQLPSGHGLLIPIATVMPLLPSGLRPFREDEWVYPKSGRAQRSGVQMAPLLLDGWRVLDWRLDPATVKYETAADRKRSVCIRPLPGSFPLVLSRAWAGGSCPHLFEEIDGELHYIGDIFSTHPGESGAYEHRVSSRAEALVVAELEDEVTHVVSVAVDGREVFGRTTLRHGDVLRIPLTPGEGREYVLVGWYESSWLRPTSALDRSVIVGGFVAAYSGGPGMGLDSLIPSSLIPSSS